MVNIAFLLIINLGFSYPVNSTIHFGRAALLDTIPTGKMILYTADPAARNDRKELYLRNFSRLMGLPSLHDKSHELLVRIWLWNFGERYVIDIGKEASQYSCSVTSWHGKSVDSNLYIVISKSWPVLVPKAGWNQFVKTLNRYQILKLNSGLSFEEHDHHLTQSSYIQFEIEENGKYRFYEYLEPSYYRFVETGSNKVYRFLKYFDEQMGIDAYAPPENLYERKQ